MRKRISIPAVLRAAVVLGILLCLTAAVGASNAYADNGAGTVTASALNMRAEPSTSSAVVTTVPRGTVVLVLESSNGWYKVRYQGQTGYMSGEYLTFSATADGDFGTGSVQGNYVNVRSGPGTGYAVIGSVSTGQSFSVTGVSDGWYKISYNGATGYVSGDYLSVGGGTAAPAPVQTAASQTQTAAQGTGVITGDYVRMRSGPSTGYSVVGTYNNGAQMTITGQSGDWYAVSCNGKTGYVYKQYLSQSGATASVTAMDSTPARTTAGVNLREGPSTAYTSKQVLPAGTSVTLTGKSGQWYRVSYGSVSGFIHGDYVTTNTASSAAAPSAAGAISSDAGQQIVNEAKKYLGVRYVYGGTSPSGFDCSGFVYYVYRQCGYSITRTATAQNSVGAKVARADMQPGDIIIFYNGARSAIGHAGIYIGGNQFIHASSGGGKVMISSLSESYYNTRFYSARRVVK